MLTRAALRTDTTTQILTFLHFTVESFPLAFIHDLLEELPPGGVVLLFETHPQNLNWHGTREGFEDDCSFGRVLGISHIVVSEVESVASENDFPSVYINGQARLGPTTKSITITDDCRLHGTRLDIVGHWPSFAQHIVVLHNFLEEVHTKTVVLYLLVAALATKGLLHFGRTVEQLEVGRSKKLTFLVLALTNDDFEEV